MKSKFTIALCWMIAALASGPMQAAEGEWTMTIVTLPTATPGAAGPSRSPVVGMAPGDSKQAVRERQVVMHGKVGPQGLVDRLAGGVFGIILTGLIWAYYRKRFVPSELKYRTFAPRLWTGPVDGVMLLPVTVGAAFLMIGSDAYPAQALGFALSNVLWIVYSILLHGWCGQTVGKMVTKVRVVDHRTEGPITWRQAVLRDALPLVILGFPLFQQVAIILRGGFPALEEVQRRSLESGSYWLVTSLPLLWLVAELITMLTNAKRRSLHDFIAGTVVIRTNLREPRALS